MTTFLLFNFQNIRVYSGSSPARSRSGEAGGVVSFILFSLYYFWLKGAGFQEPNKVRKHCRCQREHSDFMKN
jgi:hypothetical protein